MPAASERISICVADPTIWRLAGISSLDNAVSSCGSLLFASNASSPLTFASSAFCAETGKTCAGGNSSYNIRMGRSRKVTGPFLDNMGIDMLQGGGKLFAENVATGTLGDFTLDFATPPLSVKDNVGVAVPEPSSWVLCLMAGVGLAACGFFRWRAVRFG